ncbi:MAG: hypothetical protein MUF24_03040 [Chitinophagaceae bacterium]|jgi:hypothetical protein|nr:hypothetical protein [Chitinophagaceae bacterium]
MKKIFFSSLFAVISLLAIAGNNNPKAKKNNPSSPANYQCIQGLENLFGKVDNVAWTTTKNDLIRANFSLDGESYSVFFEKDGSYVATTRRITLSNVPAPIRVKIKEKFSPEQLETLVHYTSSKDEAYFVEVTTDSKTTIWRISTEGKVEKF